MHCKVGIVIPTKGNVELLKSCVESIYETQHDSFSVYIADTGSTENELNEIIEFCKDIYLNKKPNIHLIQYDYYNFAKINNNVINTYMKDIDLICFCNNDIRFIDDFITSAINLFNSKLKTGEIIGTIGCKLLFPDGTVQHAGQWGHIKETETQMGLTITHRGYQKPNKKWNKTEKVFGNTFAAAITPMDVWKKIGGLNENYVECFEDVEYNLSCKLNGHPNYYIGNVTAIHHESKTRNDSMMKNKRMQHDYFKNLMPFVDENYDELIKDNEYRND